MLLFNLLAFALALKSSFATKYDNGEEGIVYFKRVDTGLPDLNEPASQTHLGGRIAISPAISHSSNSRPIPDWLKIASSHTSTSNERDQAKKDKKAQERRERHAERVRIKRKTMKETYEKRYSLGFTEEKIKEIEVRNQAEKDVKNERNRIRCKASRERIQFGTPTQTDLNFIASQRRSSLKWHKNNPEKAAKAKKLWAQRNPERVRAASEKRTLKRKFNKNQIES